MAEELDRFDDALREWANRAPGRTGAEAAQAVSRAIRMRRRRRLARWSGLAAAAALVIAVSTGIIWRPKTPPTFIVAAGDIRTAGLADGVVLMWLDDETPLYMTFQADGGQAAMQGETP